MAELLVADSFRVREHPVTGVAEVRRFDWHLERFRASASEALTALSSNTAGSGADALAEFMREFPGRIAGGGAGFPRIELVHEPTTNGGPGTVSFNVQLRPLPRLADTIELRRAPVPALQRPRVKGPGLARLGQLNQELGAEGLLIDTAGFAIEGATTSLAWWEGDVLSTSAATDRIGSVTERILLETAHRTEIPTSRRAITADDLARREVWALNALHGIRLVASIDGVRAPEPDLRRLAAFREALERTWMPVLADTAPLPDP